MKRISAAVQFIYKEVQKHIVFADKKPITAKTNKSIMYSLFLARDHLVACKAAKFTEKILLIHCIRRRAIAVKALQSMLFNILPPIGRGPCISWMFDNTAV